MTDTREKLLEAKYFLERMKKELSDRDAFKYNLSAFLAAARSITLFMQKELNKTPDFKKWYAEKQSKMQNDKTMKFLNDKRRMTIHEQAVRPRAHVNAHVSGKLTFSPSLSAIIIRGNGSVEKKKLKSTFSPSKSTETETIMKWRWYFNELPEKDVVTVCEEYIAKLESLVVELECDLLK